MDDFDNKIINFLTELGPKLDELTDLLNELITLHANGPKNDKTELLFQTTLAKIIHNFGRVYLQLNNTDFELFDKKAEKLTKHLNTVRFEAGLGKRLRINKNAVRNMFHHLLTPIPTANLPAPDSDDDADVDWN